MLDASMSAATERKTTLQLMGWVRWGCPCCGPKPKSTDRARSHRVIRRAVRQALHTYTRED